jgi:hypothetical protein
VDGLLNVAGSSTAHEHAARSCREPARFAACSLGSEGHSNSCGVARYLQRDPSG